MNTAGPKAPSTCTGPSTVCASVERYVNGGMLEDFETALNVFRRRPAAGRKRLAKNPAVVHNEPKLDRMFQDEDPQDCVVRLFRCTGLEVIA